MVDPEAQYALARGLLGLSRRQDAAAAERLANLLVGRRVIEPETLRKTFRKETTVVLGSAPGGIQTLEAMEARGPVVVAGSGIRRAHEAKIRADLVVTDLDGSDEAHLAFSRAGVPMAVHAHGDNTLLVERLVHQLTGPIFGTSQTEPPTSPVALHRFGGFTDGDRACFLAAALGARDLVLVGWDLEHPVPDTPGKRVKMEIAALLLDDLPVPWRFL